MCARVDVHGVVKTASDMKLIEEQDFMCARHVSVEE